MHKYGMVAVDQDDDLAWVQNILDLLVAEDFISYREWHWLSCCLEDDMFFDVG